MWTNLIFDYSLLIMKVGIIVHMAHVPEHSTFDLSYIDFVHLNNFILICRLWDAEIVRLCYFEQNIFELD